MLADCLQWVGIHTQPNNKAAGCSPSLYSGRHVCGIASLLSAVESC